MVDILNLRTNPESATSSASPTRELEDSKEHAQVTSPPALSFKESIVQGLRSTTVQVAGGAEDDDGWSYTKTIPTSTPFPCLSPEACFTKRLPFA